MPVSAPRPARGCAADPLPPAAGGAAKPTTNADASRIQSSQVSDIEPARRGGADERQAKAGADTGKGSFPARAQAGAARNAAGAAAGAPAAKGAKGKAA